MNRTSLKYIFFLLFLGSLSFLAYQKWVPDEGAVHLDSEMMKSARDKHVIDEEKKKDPSEPHWQVVLRDPKPHDIRSELRPRKTPNKETLRIPPKGEQLEVRVKFKDQYRARATKDGFVSLVAGDIPADLATLVENHQLSFHPGIENVEESLADVIRRAEANTGTAQMDFAGILIAAASGNASRDAAVALAKDLHALEMVEYVELNAMDVLIPPPLDLAPTTPDYASDQTYSHGANGIQMDDAWTYGAKGYGVRVSDCEYSYLKDHEDLTDTLGNEIVTNGSFASYDPNSPFGTSHGTAVLGIMAAPDNGYGMTGMVHEADFHFYSEWANNRSNRTRSIADAIAQSGEGDVVVLEMQNTVFGDDYGPEEQTLTSWNLVKVGTDAGVIVVAAAGNGNQDLDSAAYQEYRNRGDSGAIIVGAGSQAGAKLGFSTYGSRVDLQGWGNNVATLQAGDEDGQPSNSSYDLNNGDLKQLYTLSFSGTSSATPVVTSAVVAVQGLHRRVFGTAMTPAEIRTLLKNTGTAQSTGGAIGPRPHLTNAIGDLLGSDPYFYFAYDSIELAILFPGDDVSATGVSLADYGYFGNGASVSYSKSSGPTWLSVASDGTLSGVPSNDDLGDNVFTVLIHSGAESKSMEVTIPVELDPTGAPVISNPDFYTATFQQPFQLQVDATQFPTSYEAVGLPNGLSIDSSSGLLSGTVAATGSFSVTLKATNALGTGIKHIEVNVASALPAAVGTPLRNWRSSGSLPFFWQDVEDADSGGAAQSGAIANGESSWMETVLVGPATVSFQWKVSSESEYDFLRVLLDGEIEESISGDVDWTEKTINVSAGVHTLRFVYDKDAYTSSLEDAGWVDSIVGLPNPVIESFGLVSSGSNQMQIGFQSTSGGAYRISTSEDLQNWQDSGYVYAGNGSVAEVLMDAPLSSPRLFARVASQDRLSTSFGGFSSAASSDDGNVPANVLDGDLGTYWSAAGVGEWIELQFASASVVDAIKIAFHEGDQRTASFKVEGMVNSNWVEWLPQQDSSGTTSGFETYFLSTGEAPATALRITGYGNALNDMNCINEIEVVGVSGFIPTSLIVDSFASTSVILNTRIRESSIDKGWQAGKQGGGSEWMVSGGTLQNASVVDLSGHPNYIPSEAPVGQSISTAGLGISDSETKLVLSFEYAVPVGDILRVYLWGHTGVYDSSSNNIIANLETRYGLGNNESRTTLDAFNLLNGDTTGFGSANGALATFNGGTSGIYTTTIDLATLGITAVTKVNELTVLTLSFAKDEDGQAGTTSISDLRLITAQ